MPFKAFLGAQKALGNTTSTDTTADQYGLKRALRSRDASQIMSAVDSAVMDGDNLRNMSKTVWLEILRLVTPSTGRPGIHRIHRSTNQRHLQQIGYAYKNEQRQILSWLTKLVSVRRQRGDSMGLIEYKTLLQSAANLGNARIARVLWEDMKYDAVIPDVACYNYYMEALVFDEWSRMIQLSRSSDTLPRQDHKITRIMLFRAGMLKEIDGLFKEMASHGLAGDTTTFCALMHALARDGDISAVGSILQKVWGFDVEAILNQELVELPARYPPSSPLYPNVKLLATLAHVYGLHNKISFAIRLLDTIAQQFDLPMKSNIYYQLTQWTWLQARYKPPAGPDRQKIRKEHNMNLNVVTELFDSMLADPYAKAPSVEKYHLGLRGTLGPFRSDRSFEPMEDARALYIRAVEHDRRALHAYRSARQSLTRLLPHINILRLRSQVVAAELEKRKRHMYLQRFARIVLRQYVPRTWVASDLRYQQMEAWQARGIPDFIAKWETFVPSVVNYRMGSGHVQLQVRDESTIEANKERRAVAAQRVKKLIWRNIDSKRWIRQSRSRRGLSVTQQKVGEERQ